MSLHPLSPFSLLTLLATPPEEKERESKKVSGSMRPTSTDPSLAHLKALERGKEVLTHLSLFENMILFPFMEKIREQPSVQKTMAYCEAYLSGAISLKEVIVRTSLIKFKRDSKSLEVIFVKLKAKDQQALLFHFFSAIGENYLKYAEKHPSSSMLAIWQSKVMPELGEKAVSKKLEAFLEIVAQKAFYQFEPYFRAVLQKKLREMSSNLPTFKPVSPTVVMKVLSDSPFLAAAVLSFQSSYKWCGSRRVFVVSGSPLVVCYGEKDYLESKNDLFRWLVGVDSLKALKERVNEGTVTISSQDYIYLVAIKSGLLTYKKVRRMHERSVRRLNARLLSEGGSDLHFFDSQFYPFLLNGEKVERLESVKPESILSFSTPELSAKNLRHHTVIYLGQGLTVGLWYFSKRVRGNIEILTVDDMRRLVAFDLRCTPDQVEIYASNLMSSISEGFKGLL